MPYFISPLIRKGSPGMWLEGDSYNTESIYRIESGKLPPVNYDRHIFKPHSLCHFDSPLHIEPSGKSIGDYYRDADFSSFYGETWVIKVPANIQSEVPNKTILNKESLLQGLKASGYKKDSPPDRLLITLENVPYDSNDYHDANHILVLDEPAAEWLVSNQNFRLLGTSWKSTDHQPGSRERPIHRIIFQRALILELLKLKDVPPGRYFLSAFPLPLEEASESLVSPVLFTEADLKTFIK